MKTLTNVNMNDATTAKTMTKFVVLNFFLAALASFAMLGDFAKEEQAKAQCYGPAMPLNELCQNVKAPHLN